MNTPIAATLEAQTDHDAGTALLSLSHGLDGTPDATVQLFDAAGNTVFSATGASFPYTLPLRDNAGNELPQGRYTARVLLHHGLQYGATPPVEIIVMK